MICTLRHCRGGSKCHWLRAKLVIWEPAAQGSCNCCSTTVCIVCCLFIRLADWLVGLLALFLCGLMLCRLI